MINIWKSKLKDKLLEALEEDEFYKKESEALKKENI